MSATLVRFGAVLLALAQLGVWGFYAPAHRLTHHSGFAVAAKSKADAKPSCHHAGCCSHSGTKAEHSAADPHHAPAPSCPDDAGHCVVCVLALHQAHSPDDIVVTGDLLPVFSPLEVAAPVQALAAPTAFHSRAPPSA